jgi:hypothetical protein
MLGYFKDFMNTYFLKPEYEITPMKVNANLMKSDWYFLKFLFENDELEQEETK